MGLRWLFLSVSSGPVTGFHLSVAKWKFLQERLLNFCTFSVVMIFSFFCFYSFFLWDVQIYTGQWTNPMCLLPSFNNNIWHSYFTYSSNFSFVIVSFWCRFPASCYLLVSYIEPYIIANVGQNLELQNRNFILFNLTTLLFFPKETPYTYQIIFLTPTEDLSPNVEVHLILEACLPLFLNSSHSGV